MQRTATVSLASLVLGLLATGCPDKKVEKEEPTAPVAPSPSPKAAARNAADDKAAEEDRGEDPEEHAADEPKDEKRPLHKRRPDKKEQAGEEKDQGGW